MIPTFIVRLYQRVVLWYAIRQLKHIVQQEDGLLILHEALKRKGFRVHSASMTEVVYKNGQSTFVIQTKLHKELANGRH